MLNKNSVVFVSIVYATLAGVAEADACGSEDVLSRMQQQAQAYASGANYLEFQGPVKGKPSDLCAESEAATRRRNETREQELTAQASSYVTGFQFDAHMIAEVEMNWGQLLPY